MMEISNQKTFKAWVQNKIKIALNHKPNQYPLLIWCDPQRNWKDLLKLSLDGGDIQLWSDEIHELALRNRVFTEPSAARVIWLPVDRNEISYFMVYALQAEQIIQISISEALDDFGVDLPVDQIQSIESILPAHALQWLEYPLSFWKEKFSIGEVKVSLVDDETILTILSSPGKALPDWITKDRLPILNRRVVEDFGFPPLYEGPVVPDLLSVDVEGWRVHSTAAMLVTEAEAAVPATPPGDQEKAIHNPAARDRALKLLTQWQNKFDQVDAFEELVIKADALTTLQYWSKNLPAIASPLSSLVVESVRFQIEMEALVRLETFDELSQYLSRHIDTFRDHANGYWGKRAKKRVGWAELVDLAESCVILKQYAGIEKGWQELSDATSWFVERGWRGDWIGERLFKEDDHLSGALIGVRSKLRHAYLRHLDRINTAFSELVSKSLINKSLQKPFEYIGEHLVKGIQLPLKQPTAVIITDACRYDIGCRLVELINQSEPTRRAEVVPACAPIPTITPLGMTFALPGIVEQVHVQLLNNPVQPWLITTEHFAGNLAEAAQRREWLKQAYKVKDQAFLNIDQVLNNDSTEAISSKTIGRLVFVFGDELDDHEGVLKPFGLDGVIDRYASLIRRLQSGGFNTIFLVTDHGFFHWEPAPDEKDGAKPEGDILWKSRRAVVGCNLKHNTALQIKLPKSDLECCIPRSINSFKTYGGLGFFHGGLTLQEWIIPIVSVHFPQKSQKIGGVLKPITQITSLAQRIQVAPQATQLDLFGGQAHEDYLSRAVVIKVIQPATGKIVFRTKNQSMLEPGGDTIALELMTVPGSSVATKSELEMLLLDADDEEILDRLKVILQVVLDDWE